MDPIKGETSDSSDKEFVSFLDASPANFDGKNMMAHPPNERSTTDLTNNSNLAGEKNQDGQYKSAQ